MRDAGNVVFAEVITLPNGMSKGCGIVEYSSQDEARKAIDTLNETELMGRTVFVREDREDEARFGQPASPFSRGGAPIPMGRGGFMGGRGGMMGGPPGFGGGGYGRGGGGMGMGMGGGSTQIFLNNLSFEVGWQDLKDLIRSAGATPVRADVIMGPDGRPKGSGQVTVADPQEAQVVIANLNGYNWNGRTLEVKYVSLR